MNSKVMELSLHREEQVVLMDNHRKLVFEMTEITQHFKQVYGLLYGPLPKGLRENRHELMISG